MVIGGVQLLFIRLAEELSKNKELEVKLIDFKNGYLQSQLKSNPNVEIINYCNSPISIGCTTVIMPLSHLVYVEKFLKLKTNYINLLLWSLHPDNIRHLLYENGRKWFINKKKVNTIINDLVRNGFILFMDEANYSAFKEVTNIQEKPQYLPVPLSIEPSTQSTILIKKNNSLNIGWLGRISYEKIYAIYKIVDDIKNSIQNENVIFHIIGDGDRVSELIHYLKKNGISYQMPGILEKEKLTQYLLGEIDLGIAMGTSCLEFAMRKIPTIIIDFSLKKYPKFIKYNWLFETQYFNLGNHIDKAINNKHCFSEILQQLDKNNELGQRCYDYVITHHSVSEVSTKLVEHLSNMPDIDINNIYHLNRLLNPISYSYLYNCAKFIKNFLIKIGLANISNR